jgi:hypothetical protein
MRLEPPYVGCYKVSSYAFALVLAMAVANMALAQPTERSRDRRSQRVRMEEVKVTSPDGKVQFTLLPNAERLSYSVAMGGTTVIATSTLSLIVDGYDLASGVIFSNVTRLTINETYAWHGVHRTATNHCHSAVLQFTHDLSFTQYTLEVRAFNNPEAYAKRLARRLHATPHRAASLTRHPPNLPHVIAPDEFAALRNQGVIARRRFESG